MSLRKKNLRTLTGRVETVLVGRDISSHKTTPVKKIKIFVGHGVNGDLHAGPRLLDSREDELLKHGLPKGIQIANVREISLVSTEELEKIGSELNLPTKIPFGLLGENIVISGIPHFTQLPPGTILVFKTGGGIRTAAIAIWKENGPCAAPGKALSEHFKLEKSLAGMFVKAAQGKRGLVGFVYSTGEVAEGDTVICYCPSKPLHELHHFSAEEEAKIQALLLECASFCRKNDEITPRLANILAGQWQIPRKFFHVVDIVEYTRQQFLNEKNAGKKSADTLEQCLRKYGLAFDMQGHPLTIEAKRRLGKI